MTEDQYDEDSVYRGRERVVLAAALKASGMSARQAAVKMDFSDTRLRHIVNGYQPMGHGRRVAVIAPADTLARIAMVLNVGADELEAAGRGDAARELRSRQRELASWGDDSVAIVSVIRDWAEDPVNHLAPDDALRFFEDSALLGELERRLDRLREHARGEAPHGYQDAHGPSAVHPVGNELSDRDQAELDALDLKEAQAEVRKQQEQQEVSDDDTDEEPTSASGR